MHSSSDIHNGTPPNIKYLYFNNLNLAEKITPGIQCDKDAYKLLADLKADLGRYSTPN